jgi:hypothetical protein
MKMVVKLLQSMPMQLLTPSESARHGWPLSDDCHQRQHERQEGWFVLRTQYHC